MNKKTLLVFDSGINMKKVVVLLIGMFLLVGVFSLQSVSADFKFENDSGSELMRIYSENGNMSVLGNISTGQFFVGDGRYLTNIDTSSLNLSEVNYWTKSGSDVYYNDGNIGIGTTSPGAKLTAVTSDAWNLPPLRIGSDDGNEPFVDFKSGTGGFAISVSNGSNNAFAIQHSSGNVGIGTTSPNQKLHISGGNINIDENYAYLYDGQQAVKLAKGTDTVYTNTFVGQYAGNSSAYRQTALGYAAGHSNTGNSQTALGYTAGYLNSGAYQTAVGYYAGYSNSGVYQTALGYYAGRENSGISQTALGYSAGYSNSGAFQTALGFYAGQANAGDRVIGIGYEATRNNSATADDVVAIGYQAGKDNTVANQFIVKQANINSVPLIQGDFATGNVGIGTTSPDKKLTVQGNAINVKSSSNVMAYLGERGTGADGGFMALYEAGAIKIGLNANGNSYFNGGKVGIGTTSPTHTLNVEGDINVSNSEVKMYMQGGALVIEG